MGFPVRYSDSELSPKLYGATEGLPSEDPKKVAFMLNTAHKQSIPYTFGHEIGHVFLTLVLGQKPHEVIPNESLELFCEYFGQEFILPSNLIEQIGNVDEATIKELMSIHHLRLRDVLTRLMLGGKLPEKVAVDSRIPIGGKPEYSNKMCRTYACLRCNRGEACSVYGEQISVLRFPEENWWDGAGDCTGGGKEPDYFWDSARRETLNRQYQEVK